MKVVNPYLERRATQQLSPEQQQDYADHGAESVENDVLRSMLSPHTVENDTNEYPNELPPEVFEQLRNHAFGARAYVDVLKDRVNVQGPRLEKGMLDLAGTEVAINGSLIWGAAESSEDLAEDLPPAWAAAGRYASEEQREILGDVPRTILDLESRLGASHGFMQEMVRVPGGPALVQPGTVLSESVGEALPILADNVDTAHAYEADTTASEARGELQRPGIVGHEHYHLRAMILAGVPRSVLVDVLEESDLSFSDFPDLAAMAFADEETGGDMAIDSTVSALHAQLSKGVDECDTRIVDLAPMESPELFDAQVQLVRSFNAIVDFRKARNRLDPRYADAVESASPEDVEMVEMAPAIARDAFDKAVLGGIYNLVDGDNRTSTKLASVLAAQDTAVDQIDIQREVTMLMYQGPDGRPSDAEYMDEAEKAAEQALAAHDAMSGKIIGLAGKAPEAPGRLKVLAAWLKAAQSAASSAEKLEAASRLGLTAGSVLDGAAVVNGIVSAGAGALKATATLLAGQHAEQVADIEWQLSSRHAADLVPGPKGAGVTMPELDSPELQVAKANGAFWSDLATRLEKVGLVGDLLATANAIRSVCQGKEGSKFDLASSAAGLSGSVAGRMVAAEVAKEGFAYGLAYGVAESANMVGFAFAYYDLIQSSFAELAAMERWARSMRGMEAYGKLATEVGIANRAALRAGAVQHMAATNTDEARRPGLEKELKRTIREAAICMLNARRAMLAALSSSDAPDVMIGWAQFQKSLHDDFDAKTTLAEAHLRAGKAGDIELYEAGSEKLLGAMTDTMKRLDAFMKPKSEE